MDACRPSEWIVCVKGLFDGVSGSVVFVLIKRRSRNVFMAFLFVSRTQNPFITKQITMRHNCNNTEEYHCPQGRFKLCDNTKNVTENAVGQETEG